jgi:DNA polymerase III delta prime subunit
MAIEWTRLYRPISFDDMALYPLLRKRLNFYAKTGEFSHLLMVGDTGVGKTTAARILASLCGDSTIEFDCTKNNGKADMEKIARGTTAVVMFGTRRLIILDEFHKCREDAQVVFNKTMEDDGNRNTFIFCVNRVEENAVAAPIVSRCTTLRFDAGIINVKTEIFQPFKHTGITKAEWIKELKRVGELVAKKDGKTPTEEQLDIVASNELYIVDPRKYIRELEEQIKMDEMEEDL